MKNKYPNIIGANKAYKDSIKAIDKMEASFQGQEVSQVDNCKHELTQNHGYIYCHKCTFTIFNSKEPVRYKELQKQIKDK